MGKVILEYLDGNKIYACNKCNTHLSCEDELYSKEFTGQSGRAFLFSKGINYVTGTIQDKELRTGLHKIAEIKCLKCGKYLGWKYFFAYEQQEKYKEGKIILERAFLEKIKWDE